MKILVVGQGGREHALAWKLAQSDTVEHVFVAPGNGGTEGLESISNVALNESNFNGLIAFAQRESIALTVIGPEVPLAEGIVDAFTEAGLACFGPGQKAAQIEASKAFSKAFMARHNIPSSRYAVFNALQPALAHLKTVDYPVVIKASGLAAGKGVILPQSLTEAEQVLRQMMTERAFGSAGDEIVIEERLSGPEVSVLAFSDGETVIPMPPAQDHKRAYEGDAGPNTGGMGAYAPAPILSEAMLAQVTESILQPAINGLKAEGSPFVGILYAGLMLTPAGPQVLEFNCRFGDPETQVILPLLKSDLAQIFMACLQGTLAACPIEWHSQSAATVVMASGGYPGAYQKGFEISGVAQAEALPDTVVFQAGTKQTENGCLLTNGGRVLAVTGLGHSLNEALERAYAGANCIQFEGMHFRRDIGRSGK